MPGATTTAPPATTGRRLPRHSHHTGDHNNSEAVKAVVLVGGQGTRLRPLTLTTPKQMLPVAGRPMIERVVAHLAAHGVDEVVLSLGYRPDAFMAAYRDGRCAGVRLRYAVEPEPLDTAGGIAFAARYGRHRRDLRGASTATC